jgi:hypothetical protein
MLEFILAGLETGIGEETSEEGLLVDITIGAPTITEEVKIVIEFVIPVLPCDVVVVGAVLTFDPPAREDWLLPSSDVTDVNRFAVHQFHLNRGHADTRSK